jgi:hypothetical protein
VPTPADTESLVAYLSTRDVPCPGCAYSLRGLKSDHCPECHQQIVLGIALAEPPIVQFALAVIGLAACGAAAGLLFLGVLAICVKKQGLPPEDAALLLLWVPAVITGLDAAAVTWMLRPARRRWFYRRTRGGCWTVMLGCWAVSLAVLAGWLMAMFHWA